MVLCCEFIDLDQVLNEIVIWNIAVALIGASFPERLPLALDGRLQIVDLV
jgi:hypothetical protein